MLKTKVIYVRQFWLLSGVWWYSEGEGVKSWDQSILKCGQRFWLSLFDMTCWQHWHFSVILLSWPHKATASNCEISVLLPNKMCTPDISESYPPLSSIFPDTPYLPMDVHFRVVHIFYSSQFSSVVSNSWWAHGLQWQKNLLPVKLGWTQLSACFGRPSKWHQW